MAYDKLVDSTQLDADLTSVADAIRAKSGGSGSLAFPVGFVSEIEAIESVGSGPQWELIGTTTIALEEYTDDSTSEVTDTGINIQNTDWAYGIVIITCDTPITSSTEWGMTIELFERYTSNSNLMTSQAAQQKGSATLSKAGMVTNGMGTNAYGVVFGNNASTIIISRKCHSTACPKCRAGNYTVSVYGLKSI